MPLRFPVFVLVVCLPLQAAALSRFILHHDGPSVGGQDVFWEQRTPLENAFYDREQHDSIGISFTVQQDSGNMLMPGEYWTLSLIETITGKPVIEPLQYRAEISTMAVDEGKVCIFPVYGGPDGWTQLNDPRRICFESSMPYGMRQWAMYGQNWRIPCENPGQYEIRVAHFLSTYRSHFAVNDFRPGKPVISGVEDITPKTDFSKLSWIQSARYQAGEMAITVKVTDSQGCGYAMSNVPVTLETTIVHSSGGYLHDTTPVQSGTGRFIASTPQQEEGGSDTRITVRTDSAGLVYARYRAGIYGVEEHLQASVTDRETGTERSQLEKYMIRVPDLVPLSTASDFLPYSIAGGGSPCDEAHNDQRGGHAASRHAVYLTHYAAHRAHQLALMWYGKEGNPKLSYNDASLPYGGYFDNGSFDISEAEQFNRNPNVYCHMGHRQGTGIDINALASGIQKYAIDENGQHVHDSGGRKIREEVLLNIGTEAEPNWVLAVDELNRLAVLVGGVRVKEPSIHYQFDL